VSCINDESIVCTADEKFTERLATPGRPRVAFSGRGVDVRDSTVTPGCRPGRECFPPRSLALLPVSLTAERRSAHTVL